MKKQNLSISSFRRFFLFLGILGLVFILFVVGVNFALEKYVVFKSEISGASKVNRILNEEHMNEIPIFGSSRANSSYVPSILGENYRNYGIDGTHANVWLFFLREELKKNKQTPIVINFDLEGLQSSIGDINNYIPNAENKDVQELLSAYKTCIPKGFFKYYGSIDGYLNYNLNESFSLTKVVENGGSFSTEPLAQSKFNLLVKQRKNSKGAFLVNDTLYQEFTSLLGSTKRQIFLVVAPYHTSFFTQFINLETIEIYKSMLSKYSNCVILDYSRMSLEDSNFKNTSHLNYQGACNFTKELKKGIDVNRN